MTRRRVPPQYLRLVIAAEQPSSPAGLSAQGEPAETENEVDRVIRPIVEAGRSIISAGVAAILDAAAGYGFDWDRDELRPAITDIVGRKLHDDVIAVCTSNGIDHNTAARHLIHGHERDAVADAISNSIIQDIAKALRQYGCPGGLGDSRALRAVVREIVARNISHRDGRDD